MLSPPLQTAASPQPVLLDQFGAARSWAWIHTAYPQCTWWAQPASQADSLLRKKKSQSKTRPPSASHHSHPSLLPPPHPCHTDSFSRSVSCSTSLTHPALTTASTAVAWINRPQQLGQTSDQDHPTRPDRQGSPCCLCLWLVWAWTAFYLLKFINPSFDKWACNCLVWARKRFVYSL